MEKQLRPMIELKNINKSYVQGTNSYHVLHDINLTIAQGEFLAIMGQSGSGKSTLINIIGFLDVNSKVLISTMNIRSMNIHGLNFPVCEIKMWDLSFKISN